VKTNEQITTVNLKDLVTDSQIDSIKKGIDKQATSTLKRKRESEIEKEN